MRFLRIFCLLATIPIFLWAFSGSTPCLGADTAVEADIDIKPQKLNPQSRGRWINCKITPPDSYVAEDIDPGSLIISEIGVVIDIELEGIWWAITDAGEVLVKFFRQEVNEVITDNDLEGEVEIMVEGTLSSGFAEFFGTDTIKIKKSKNPK